MRSTAEAPCVKLRFNRRRTRHVAFRSLLAIALVRKPLTYNMLLCRNSGISLKFKMASAYHRHSFLQACHQLLKIVTIHHYVQRDRLN